MKRLFAFSGLIASIALLAGPALPQVHPQADADPVVVRAPEAPVPTEIPIALLVDLSSGQTLFARDADRRFVPASVTKVMTAYTAFSLVEQGRLPLDRKIIISRELEDEWSGEGSTMFLQAGERPTVGELLLGITTISANDGAVALAVASTGSQAAWLELMNAHAAQLGMRDTHFGTPNGWPDEGRTFTTARDLAILAEALTARYPDLYRRYFGNEGMTWRNITQANHDPITGRVEGADGLKTGFTRQSGFNFLGSAERDGRRLVMILAAAPSARLRDETARALMEWGFASFTRQHIIPAGTPVGLAMVQDGGQDTVGLMTASDVIASIPEGANADVSLTVRYRGPIKAPVGKGQGIGTLRVTVPGQEPHDVPLVASETIAKANVLQRLRNGLAKLFS